MTTCVARKGFLTLSDCGNTAVTSCTNCGRPMCSAHLAPQSGFTMCLDCAATTTPQEEGQYDDVWAHRYRDSYYTTTGFAPLYGATSHYDSQDARSFDSRPDDFTEDETESGGFGDS